MEKEGKKTIFWYGIPAYGHVHSNLYLAGCLANKGFRIVYYSFPEFRKVIEANGCNYRSYPVSSKEIVLRDGSQILKLYRLILQYTQRMLPVLEKETRQEDPDVVFFDSLALWGRVIGQRCKIPSYSFYSIIGIGKAGDAAFWAYARGFYKGFLQCEKEWPQIWRLRRELKKEWRLKELGMQSVLMNQGDCNLMGYSRRFQPGGKKFGGRYLFLGPMAVHRQIVEKNDFECPEGILIYISLGTIFNRNEQILKEIIIQLGGHNGEISECARKTNPEYSVVLVWDESDSEKQKIFPKNFIVRRFVNQGEIMQRASLFITAGGMNSIHEALYYGVPCLMYPQQGEQYINARQFEQLGFGRILKDPSRLEQEMIQTMKLGRQWREQWRQEMLQIRTEQLWRKMERERRQ